MQKRTKLNRKISKRTILPLFTTKNLEVYQRVPNRTKNSKGATKSTKCTTKSTKNNQNGIGLGEKANSRAVTI